VKLYHFAPAHLLDGIQKHGLVLGSLPIITETETVLVKPCQWLTSDGDFDGQSWATRELILYDRTAVRLTVAIPKTAMDRLWNAHDFLPNMPGESGRIITDWGGSEHWYLFFGKIPPVWIREVAWKHGRSRRELEYDH
jgi:hypothetical protein